MPLTVRMPFSIADTIALISDGGLIEFLDTSTASGRLVAQVSHLSYLITLANNFPTKVADIPDITVVPTATDAIIDLTQYVNDDDLAIGDQLTYSLQLSPAGNSPFNANIDNGTLTLDFDDSGEGAVNVTVIAADTQGKAVPLAFKVTSVFPRNITATPSPLPFGVVNSGTSMTNTLNLRNDGQTGVKITHISSSWSGIQLVNSIMTPIYIPIGSNTDIDLELADQLTPLPVSGVKLEIKIESPVEITGYQIETISVQVQLQYLEVDSNTVDFGIVVPGMAVDRQIDIHNTIGGDTSQLVINSITSNLTSILDISPVESLPVTLAANEQLEVNLALDTSVDSLPCSLSDLNLTIYSDDPTTPSLEIPIHISLRLIEALPTANINLFV